MDSCPDIECSVRGVYAVLTLLLLVQNASAKLTRAQLLLRWPHNADKSNFHCGVGVPLFDAFFLSCLSECHRNHSLPRTIDSLAYIFVQTIGHCL